MSTTVAKYTFTSWQRKGIGALVNETDTLGSGSTAIKERSTIPVTVAINGQDVHKDFKLLGPGDIIGVNPAMVVRTEPLNWITNFEPNYLAFIEFYDDDFAWRYTPAKANGDKLRPWIVLLVLKEGEFEPDNKTFPLPSITVYSVASLPSPTETWAWAHGHINEGYNSKTEFEAFLQSLHNLNDPNSDKIICRLVSPRKLDPNCGYHAFVVPAFETGRKAGLGEDLQDIDAQQASWKTTDNNIKFPVYYSWQFRTGENEDFESLVKILEPRTMDEKVGRRDMDGSLPGFGMTASADLGEILPAESNQAILGLEGALMAPTTKSKPVSTDLSKPFFKELQDIVNFPEEYKKKNNTETDPIVSPPIYGENHAMAHELDITKSGWLHQLNKDPRNRVPSGVGTNVIKKNQEDYVARAWQQVQKVFDGNQKILFTSFAMTFARVIKTNFVDKLKPANTLIFFSPLLKKIKGSPTTLQHQMQESTLPVASVSAAFRRIIRPRGAYYKKLKSADPSFDHAILLTDLNEEKISAAPPKQVPVGIKTVEDVVGQMPGSKLSGILKFLLKHRLWVLIILLLLLLILGLLTGNWIVVGVLAVAAIAGYFYLGRWKKELEFEEAFTDPTSMVKQIEETPPRPTFVFTETDPAVTQPAATGTTITTTTENTSASADSISVQVINYFTPGAAGQDSVESKNFRSAAISLHRRIAIRPPEIKLLPFDIANANAKILHATDPYVAYPIQLAKLVYYTFNPGWLLQPEHLVPAMAHPDFEDPMYEKLRDISAELMLPNLELIPPNTISLLETNPPFIESYMVGLNHEFGKELLWREFPTDKRGSYFRQFWDVKGIVTNKDGLKDEELVNSYKDIDYMDKWTSTSALGSHKPGQVPPGKKNLVLVVRGELLKKYPNTIIYAQKAHIYKDPQTNVADPTKESVIIEVKTDAEMYSELKFPLFKAEINPDIKFFGFDLTVEQAYGKENPHLETDDWGYYFIIQQIPGEPRFGLDIKYDPDDDNKTPITWDDMAWDMYPPKPFLEAATKPVDFPISGPPKTDDTLAQWGQDAAKMAYILYQKPVMIAVHAKEMLEKLNK